MMVDKTGYWDYRNDQGKNIEMNGSQFRTTIAFIDYQWRFLSNNS